MTTAELIRDLADPGLTTMDICQRHDCTPLELLERCESDDIRPHLDALARMADIRENIIRPDEERLARATLTHLAIPNQLPTRLSVRHDELRRKSATTLLRKPTRNTTTAKSPKRQRGASPDAQTSGPADPTPPAQPLPRPCGGCGTQSVTDGILLHLPILDPHTPPLDLIQSLASHSVSPSLRLSVSSPKRKSGRPTDDRLKDLITRAGSALSAPARAPTDSPDTASPPPGRTDHRSSDRRTPDPTARCSHA